jgi:hypothetical protein
VHREGLARVLSAPPPSGRARAGVGDDEPERPRLALARFHPDSGAAERRALPRADRGEHAPLGRLHQVAALAAARVAEAVRRRELRHRRRPDLGRVGPQGPRHRPVRDPVQLARFESLDHGRRNPTAYLQARTDDGNMSSTTATTSPASSRSTRPRSSVPSRAATRGAPSSPTLPCSPPAPTASRRRQIYEARPRARTGNNNVDAGLLRVSEWLTRREGETFPDWHPFAGTLGPDGSGSPQPLRLDTPGTHPLRMEIPDYRWRDLSAAQERDRPAGGAAQEGRPRLRRAPLP